ncbi:aminotransferase [Solemya pervernicosa gill symbiont]|uniref:Aminotransferase n=1 Tax=Solemya pervernicosa gill symbiont TaxID=642797 RepID=A0A1T2L5N0_9GAMM|nr:DegT/DnrJ/EryC1/StrS family aminotransferase [Solemya pervernicosa gill symbiont]OOZ40381.1 aminotransferase [Solemya pervernicosa gill symbiont]
MTQKEKPIYVTEPNLPPLDELIPYLEQIWKNKHLTNGGPFHQQLEDALCDYLDVPYISLFTNGTIALITALKALGVSGEVITTPYSFVATSHSLLWNDITPVFVDIDPVTLNLDPDKIDEAITSRTTAIMPVHVYGQPCEVEAIDKIAKQNNLKVIYDAAHAFGVKNHDVGILNYGDLSVLSFHATKVFNTFEGGAIVSPDEETKYYIDQLKNFGFVNETTVVETGINGKMNEFSAAVGLLQLQYIDEAIEKRKAIDVTYREGLKNIAGIRCHSQAEKWQSNYSYFPIFVEDKYPLSRDDLYEKLKTNGINARRYFYPLITEFPMYQELASIQVNNVKVAEDVAANVICLPIYPELSKQDILSVLEHICVAP